MKGVIIILDYGYRSKCCLAPIRVGRKKIKKINETIMVWVCCACGARDVRLVTTLEAAHIKNKDYLKPDIDDDKGFTE